MPINPSRVLVAIPALNEARHIEACVTSLMRPAPEMAGVSLVVADGGSVDGTREIVETLRRRYPNLDIIDNPGRLQSAGINRVVSTRAEPRHDILVRCDAHAIYPPRYVLDVAESLLAHDTVALSTPMDAVGENCFQRAAAWVADTRIGSGGSAHRGAHVSGYVEHGHHAGFRLESFRAVGGYDESFSHNEDAELDYRLTQAGGRIWLDADIRLDYSMRASLPALARQYWRYGIGRGRTVLKHRMPLRLRQMIPPLMLLAIIGGLALTPFTRLGFLPLAAYLLAVLLVSLLAMAKLRSACGLWAGPAMAAMHLPWGAGFLSRVASPRNWKRARAEAIGGEAVR